MPEPKKLSNEKAQEAYDGLMFSLQQIDIRVKMVGEDSTERTRAYMGRCYDDVKTLRDEVLRLEERIRDLERELDYYRRTAG